MKRFIVRCIAGGLFGAIANPVVGLVISMLVARLVFTVSTFAPPPPDSSSPRLNPDGGWALIVPALLIVPVAPLPGAVAVMMAQWLRSKGRRAVWLTTALIAAVQFAVTARASFEWAIRDIEMLMYDFILLAVPIAVSLFLVVRLAISVVGVEPSNAE